MGPEEEVRKSKEQEQKRATGGERIPQTLDELAALSHPELLKLYSRATVPPDMKALDGQLHGRLLAVRGTGHGWMFDAFAALGRWRSFPWEGKNLQARTPTEGVGINRMNFPRRGHKELFPFTTSFDPSALDGAPCVFINYDHSENPSIVRVVRDEVREIAPGLFFGPVLFKHGHSTTLTMWFGLQVDGAHDGHGPS
jgi:hypothetical protein